ncbi:MULTISPECIES: hypothetical protein [Sphingomonas]|uniref:Uncharacterized protein n=1 Tax=Sphingomonas echinoides TaxID=59803 RepID=A0ABU4PRG1_9SPHN|nr:hypothetical protein [Sphingomonas echinoides]MDX5985394.1 hypothetical protein [Sphingomonas echinoides]
MAIRVAIKAPAGFCSSDAWGIFQATIAIVTLVGSFWSIGLLL